MKVLDTARMTRFHLTMFGAMLLTAAFLISGVVSTFIAPTMYLRYPLVPDLPSNFVVIGDAIMKVNPIFGQGTSEALIGAATLHNKLLHADVLRAREGSKEQDGLPDDFTTEFFETQAPKIEVVLNQTKAMDYQFPTTTLVEGEPRKATALAASFLDWYADHLTPLLQTDPLVNYTYFQFRNFLAPNTDLVAPRILGKVVWHWLTTRSTKAAMKA